MLTRLEQITDEIINLQPQQVTEGEYMVTKVNQAGSEHYLDNLKFPEVCTELSIPYFLFC